MKRVGIGKMMELANKKNVKVISLIIAAIFVIGMFALSLTQSGLDDANAETSSAIGLVDRQQIMQTMPGLSEVQNSMRSAIETSQKEFDEKSANMTDSEKQKLMGEYQEKLGAKEKELVEPLNKKLDDAISAVGKKKGLSVVVDKGVIVYGGTDVTSEVSAELKKQS